MNALNPVRWSQLWQRATGAEPPPEHFETLARLYAEPHRHYHNQHHILDCLAEFDRHRAAASDPIATELAIWFHDAIYDTRVADNEERSADLAEDWLAKSKAGPRLVTAVKSLILATKLHDIQGHPDAPLLVDIDLSILGRSSHRFWQYEGQIRQEYAWVDKVVFATKRAEILRRFLARPQIYHTEIFHQELEAPARANLTASIKRLLLQIPPD